MSSSTFKLAVSLAAIIGMTAVACAAEVPTDPTETTSEELKRCTTLTCGARYPGTVLAEPDSPKPAGCKPEWECSTPSPDYCCVPAGITAVSALSCPWSRPNLVYTSFGWICVS